MDPATTNDDSYQEAALDDLRASYDERVDVVRDMAATLAGILLNPATNSALKRNETRQEAHAALLQSINALAAMAECSSEYASAISAFEAIARKQAQAGNAASEPPSAQKKQ